MDIRQIYTTQYGSDPERIFFAPGRVNLIGEHTDYNGGHVFPCALTLGTYAAVAPREDQTIRFYSENLSEEGIIETTIGDFHPLEDTSWTSYMIGVMWAFAGRGMVMPHGLDIAVYGDIPPGAGLSSSAAMEVLTGRILRGMFGFDVTDIEIAQIGQIAENDYCGLNCGIMDQFASSVGRKNHAIFLDTATLDYELVPIELDAMKLIITNTNVKHSLTGSEYNNRRLECESALATIQSLGAQATADGRDVHHLCDLTPAEFDRIATHIEDPVARRRAKHAVTEDDRTTTAVSVLKAGNLAAFGRLMNASHASLRDDYAVSCDELDLLAEAAWTIPGVFGSRMTGGGFGGCTVSLVRDEAEAEFKEKLEAAYTAKFGHAPTFYTVSIGGQE